MTDAWKTIVAAYQEPSFWRASWQLINSVGAYLMLWIAIYFLLPHSILLTLPLVVLAAGLLTRIFIIFHDCGHGCFFKSRLANDCWGYLTGILLLVPYHHWRWRHALHHGSAGNLDHRGVGDIWTMTVNEFKGASRSRQWLYRAVRHPLLLFVIGPLFYFLVRQRFYSSHANIRERHSVWWINLSILCLAIGMSSIFGWQSYLLLQVSILALAAAAGVWLFYIQHQFEEVQWERDGNWDWQGAALKGSSYYQLPRVLQWFSGNIGFHHIHHLSSRIPNYHLERCHNENALFRNVKPVTLGASIKAAKFRLWDEANKKLVGFDHLKKAPSSLIS